MICFLGGCFSSLAQDLAFDKEQYQKALWMTARFYGAQRMGDGVNWLVADHKPSGNLSNGMTFKEKAFVQGKSFLKDADGDYDLTGGWFDCGDFVLFGQTFYYSAYMLILGYSEFPEGYEDYYSFDYNGYVSSGDYSWEGKKGVPNGIPDILDEVKYATDFIMKAVRDNKTFYYQKGDGDLDHKVWCTSPVKSALPKNQGGDADGSRPVLSASGNATTMASLAGATLAAMARLYKPFDPEYADKCLKKAIVAFEYVNNTSKGHTASAPFYGGAVNYVPGMVLLNAELYRTTGDEKYIKEAEKYCTWMDKKADYNYNYTLCYEHVEDLAAYLMATLGDASSYGNKAKEVFSFYADEMYKPTSGYILNKQSVDGWGAMRYLANQAFTLGLFAKMSGQKEVNPYALKTIEFVLGENPSNQSFVVGFGKKFPHVPHHRNFYRYDGNNMAQAPIPNDDYKFIQLGFLAGGNGSSIKTGVYTESLENYQESEGGIDYNAGLVGALGYINSVINPVNTSKFGHPTPEFEKSYSICGMRSITLNSNVAADGNKKFTWYKDGKQVESSTSASSLNVIEEGEYTCEIDSAGEWTTSATTKVMAVLPSLDVETNYELCNPASIVLNFDMSPIPCSYEWSLDGKVISTTSSYEMTKPGTYKLTISAANCPNTGAEFNVTSLLPSVEDAASDDKGNVTLKVEDDGEYEWYDVAEGGTPLHTGSTFTTTINKNTTFYVQDAGAMDIVVGPAKKSMSGGNKWSNLPVKFSTNKACSISGFTMLISSHSDGETTVEVELSGAKKATFKSNPINVKGDDQFVDVTFSEPIDIPSAGEYVLTIKNSSFVVHYLQSMTDFSSFAHQGDPITFLGIAENNQAGFMALADWKVTTGSGCARAIVKANFGNSSATELVKDNIVAGLYPNPVEDLLVIDLADNDDAIVEVINVLGRVVEKEQISGSKSTLDLSALSTGLYVVRVSNGESVYTERIIKK